MNFGEKMSKQQFFTQKKYKVGEKHDSIRDLIKSKIASVKIMSISLYNLLYETRHRIEDKCKKRIFIGYIFVQPKTYKLYDLTIKTIIVSRDDALFRKVQLRHRIENKSKKHIFIGYIFLQPET